MRRVYFLEGWNRATEKLLCDLVAVRERDLNVLILMIPNRGKGLSPRRTQNDVSHSTLLFGFFGHQLHLSFVMGHLQSYGI
jgi:hypothetical protein